MLDYELDAQIALLPERRRAEGIAAFTEKRAPTFSTAT